MNKENQYYTDRILEVLKAGPALHAELVTQILGHISFCDGQEYRMFAAARRKLVDDKKVVQNGSRFSLACPQCGGTGAASAK